jgi:hypothetical protein
MRRESLRDVRALVAGCLAVAALAGARAAQDLTRAEAVSMQTKLAGIIERANRASRPADKPLRTPVSEREVNAYLKYAGVLPVGMTEPRITIGDGGRVSGRALIDLDAIRKSRARGWTDPVNYITGSVEAIMTGTLHAANGKGVFQLASASVGGVSIPKTLLQEIVTHYSKTKDHPNGWDLDSPFVLPANIRQVEVQRGAATIVQ